MSSGAAPVEKSLKVSQVKRRSYRMIRQFPFWCVPRSIESWDSDICTPVVHSIVHDSQKVETTQMPINRWINKMGHIRRMRYLALKRKGESDTCYNMDEP